MSKSMMFLYVETPLHAGTGRALGTVDLPIQRERSTGYPMIQASGIKGRLRAHYKSSMTNDDLYAVFGPETNNAAEHAGALSFGDARLLLFPVRSLAGVFAWTTSVDALARFAREVSAMGTPISFELPKDENGKLRRPQNDKAWTSGTRNVIASQNTIILEEYAFDVEDVNILAIANELVKLLPNGTEYQYWREKLPESLCILPEDAFCDFTRYATEVQTHIKLNPDKKTVETGALWTAESLPVDTLMYVPLIAQKSRYNQLTAEQILKKIIAPEKNNQADPAKNDKHDVVTRINFGGDETTGQGFVAVKYLGG